MGITYAYGLFAHVWQVPGGWLGLREAHVHANAWGFLGLAAIGTLYDLFPRLLGTDLYSERLRDYSAWFFVAGIFPLITGPWIGMGRTVTATGLVLFATGFVLYLYNLVQTYRSTDSRSGIALSVLVAQFWMLGPAGFAPFVLFGVEWVDPAYIEDGALHFFLWGGRSRSPSPDSYSTSGTSLPYAKGLGGISPLMRPISSQMESFRR